jgi:hypothetical protein
MSSKAMPSARSSRWSRAARTESGGFPRDQLNRPLLPAVTGAALERMFVFPV